MALDPEVQAMGADLKQDIRGLQARVSAIEEAVGVGAEVEQAPPPQPKLSDRIRDFRSRCRVADSKRNAG